jgi:hypothetical protein
MRVRSTFGAIAAAGVLSAVGLGIGPAGAASPYRSAAGLYELHQSPGGGRIASMLLRANHTAEFGGFVEGTWAQPGLSGTIVITFPNANGAETWTGFKTSNGIGSRNHPGAFAIDGTTFTYFWAVLQSS